MVEVVVEAKLDSVAGGVPEVWTRESQGQATGAERGPGRGRMGPAVKGVQSRAEEVLVGGVRGETQVPQKRRDAGAAVSEEARYFVIREWKS